MKLFTLFDKKAENYGKPFTSVNHQTAIREFATACQNENSVMAMFPNDIELCFIGEFDERTGIITANDKPITITAAKEFVKKEKENGKGTNRGTGKGSSNNN